MSTYVRLAVAVQAVATTAFVAVVQLLAVELATAMHSKSMVTMDRVKFVSQIIVRLCSASLSCTSVRCYRGSHYHNDVIAVANITT
jgi:hypothetical protein